MQEGVLVRAVFPGLLAAVVLVATVAGSLAVPAIGAAPAAKRRPPLDPLQQAVVDSVSFPPRTSPPQLLDALVRTADVEAIDAALAHFGRLVATLEAAGDRRAELLADLGDAIPAAALARTERVLGAHEPGVRPVLGAIRAAAEARRRDPRRLAQAAADLRAGTPGRRVAAVDTLRRAREHALPALVDLLQSTAPAEAAARDTARALVHDLGPDARQPLVAWLGTNDVAHWPGIIAALDAADVDDVEPFLLGPALVTDTPPAARAGAIALLAKRADLRRPGRSAETTPPTRDTAVVRLAARLDRVLSPVGLPEPDCLLVEPVTDPARVPAAAGGSLDGSVARFVWNDGERRFDQLALPPRVARLQEAMHLARDLMALAPEDPAAVDRACLARLEATLVSGGDLAGAPDAATLARLRDAVAPPEGFSPTRAADVLELAVTHGMGEAAAAAAATLESAVTPEAGPLPPAARTSLVRALSVPDPPLQFAAARALARTAGEPPYPGSSRVVEVLVHAATATGIDRVVVAHPDADVGHELATDVSRFGMQPVSVATGREAIFAARGSADTVLVILAARLVGPGPLETVQFLRQQGLAAAPAVLVVVDPLDDDGRGCFLTQLLLKFASVEGVVIVDRLDSLFQPLIDATTGETLTPARFPDALARAGGPRAVDPAARVDRAEARLVRARQAFEVLAELGRRGWDVSAAATVARAGLEHDTLASPATAVLATIGRPAVQQLLAAEAQRPDLDPARRRALVAAFAASTARHGVLLDSRHLLGMYARYNRATSADSRAPLGDVIDVIETSSRPLRTRPADAAPVRSTR